MKIREFAQLADTKALEDEIRIASERARLALRRIRALSSQPWHGLEDLTSNRLMVQWPLRCFSATHPSSNDKLKKDIAKVGESPAKHRYVFFHCPGDHACTSDGDVRIIPLWIAERTGR